MALAGWGRFAQVSSALLFSLLGCSSGSASSQPAPIEMGASFDLTGTLKGVGLPAQSGTRLAEQQINAVGGVLGRPVHFNISDDTGDPTVTQRVVGQLLGTGIPAMLGPLGSGQTTAVVKTVTSVPVIEISPSATSTELSGISPYFFRTVPPDDFQGQAIALVASQNKCTSLALVHYDDAYGDPMAQVITQVFTKGGGTIAIDVKTADGKANYQTEVGQITALSTPPACIALVMYAQSGAQLIKDFKTASPQATVLFIGSDGLYDPTFITSGYLNPADPTSQFYLDGVIGTNPDTNPVTTDFNDFSNLYQAAFGPGDPEAYASNAYDAAILLALAIEKAGGAGDVNALKDALLSVSQGTGKAHGPASVAEAIYDIRQGVAINYDGASGPCNFDSQGNVSAGYIVWAVQNQKLVTIQHIKATDL
jgi:branched-chain amino acid transport system substrate-binding protein